LALRKLETSKLLTWRLKYQSELKYAADKNRVREREERHKAVIQVPSTNRK